MTGQHWDELARSVCKTWALSIWEFCRAIQITPQAYYQYARHGLSDSVRVLLMGRVRKLMVDVAYAL